MAVEKAATILKKKVQKEESSLAERALAQDIGKLRVQVRIYNAKNDGFCTEHDEFCTEK